MSALTLLARRAWKTMPPWAKARLRQLPGLKRGLKRFGFAGSSSYWEKRYATGGTSGSGSYGRLAEYKAEFLNELVERNGLESIVELGCGDGNQASLARYPGYLGLDVSATAVAQCRAKFAGDATKSFAVHDARVDALRLAAADLSLSLDVVYHLVEDDVFEPYMRHLFAAATRAVVVYSSDRVDTRTSPHVRHRCFTEWVKQHLEGWELQAVVPNRYPTTLNDGGETSFADFHVFRRVGEPELVLPP